MTIALLSIYFAKIQNCLIYIFELPFKIGVSFLYVSIQIKVSSNPLNMLNGVLKIIKASQRLSTEGSIAWYIPIIASMGINAVKIG